MGLNDTVGNRQPQPRSLLFGGKEGVEDFLPRVLWYAGAAVANADQQLVLLCAPADPQFAMP